MPWCVKQCEPEVAVDLLCSSIRAENAERAKINLIDVSRETFIAQNLRRKRVGTSLD